MSNVLAQGYKMRQLATDGEGDPGPSPLNIEKAKLPSHLAVSDPSHRQTATAPRLCAASSWIDRRARKRKRGEVLGHDLGSCTWN